jgi:hypothetical protein
MFSVRDRDYGIRSRSHANTPSFTMKTPLQQQNIFAAETHHRRITVTLIKDIKLN